MCCAASRPPADPTRPRRRAVKALLASTATSAWIPGAARAQSDRPVRLVVGFPPGGTLDVLARLVGDGLRKGAAAGVVVENKPGAGSLIAAESVARAAPDGTTLLAAPLVVTSFFPSTHAKLPFDPLRDLVPVAMLGTFRFGLAVADAHPARDLAGFVEHVRRHPGKVSFGSVSAGTPSHFLGVMLNRAAGLDMTHVPYKGGAPALTGLLGGEVEAIFDVVTNTVAQHRSGRLRILAVTGTERSALLPQVPVFRESRLGLREIDEATLWYGFFAPAGTPAATVDRQNREIARAVSDPALRERLDALDIAPASPDPAAFARFVREDSERWGAVIRATGFKVTD
jgi:tripartite-type tricarboxylate transporter receptor subunit TctC